MTILDGAPMHCLHRIFLLLPFSFRGRARGGVRVLFEVVMPLVTPFDFVCVSLMKYQRKGLGRDHRKEFSFFFTQAMYFVNHLHILLTKLVHYLC